MVSEGKRMVSFVSGDFAFYLDIASHIHETCHAGLWQGKHMHAVILFLLFP